MKYFSMFSGIGGFEYGINKSFQRGKCKIAHTSDDMPMPRSGNERRWWNSESPLCVGFSEIDKYAVQIYQKHFKGHKNYGDCTKIRWEEVEDFDCLVGGFPCQAFSIAGKRGGFSDTRGTLFFEIARCLREKQPRLCVLENVKGLLSHDKGATFFTIISTLDELGYDVEWQVLNSKNFGVPQNRERVFIIGHLRGTGGGKVFPIGESYRGDIQTHDESCTEGKRLRSDIASTLAQRDYKGGNNLLRTDKPNPQPEGNKPYSANVIRRTPYTDGMRIRRLTPTECERLQGFPDGWTEGISDSQRYKCLGNAVTTNVITAIFEKILSAMYGGEK